MNTNDFSKKAPRTSLCEGAEPLRAKRSRQVMAGMFAIVSATLLAASCSGRQSNLQACAKDTDCRGGRICNEELRCAEPSKGSAAIQHKDAGAQTEAVIADDASREPIVGVPPFAMFGGNAQNTGQLAGKAPNKAPKQTWEVKFDKAIVGSPSVGPDGTIYLSSHDHKLHAVSKEGKLLWSFATEDRIWSTPAIAVDGTVYTGSDDDHLYAIDGKTGQQKWRYRIGACTEPMGFGPEGTRCDVDGGPTLGEDGSIYVGGDGLYALWPDGRLRWKFATPEHVPTAPAIGTNGSIYIGCLDDAVYAVRPDGTKEWEFRTTRDVESAIAVGQDGSVYFGGDDKSIYSLASDGTLKWKVITRGFVRASPSIAENGTIYVGSYDKKMYAMNADGTVKWRFSAADKIHGSVGIATNGVLLFGSQDDNLYAVSPDGRLLWYLPFDADVDPTPALSQDGTLYVVGDDQSLRAFR